MKFQRPPVKNSPPTPLHGDADYLDAQYNNRLRVPHFMQHVQAWTAASALVRGSQACLLDIPYGSSSAEKLDVFPAGGTGQSVVVFLHGGYWRSLDKSDHSFVVPAFTQAGVCVVVPNYALCSAQGAVTIEDIALQIVRSMVWVHRNIAQYGGDPRCVTVVGHSAGGHLAAMMLACDWQKVASDLPHDVVRNAFSLSGLHDLAPIMRAPYLQTDLKLTSAQVLRCSPANFPAPRGTLFALCGADESDEFLRQNRLIETAWGARAVPVREAMLGLHHFSILEALLNPPHRVHQLALQLLAQ
jgi:arylformamidase